MRSKDDWMICACGKKAYGAKLRIRDEEIDGWKCKCGEKYLDPIQAERLLLRNKLKNITA